MKFIKLHASRNNTRFILFQVAHITYIDPSSSGGSLVYIRDKKYFEVVETQDEILALIEAKGPNNESD